MPSITTNSRTAIRNESPTVPAAIPLIALFDRRFPRTPFTVAPSRGNIGMSQSKSIIKRAGNRTELPSLAKEGWLRPLRKCRAASLAGADGVVGSIHRLFVEPTTPAEPSKERDHFLMARPSLLGQGGEFRALQNLVRKTHYGNCRTIS